MVGDLGMVRLAHEMTVRVRTPRAQAGAGAGRRNAAARSAPSGTPLEGPAAATAPQRDMLQAADTARLRAGPNDGFAVASPQGYPQPYLPG
jgi:hypothetical protein